MAYEIPGFQFTLVAGEDLTGSQFCAVDVERGTGQIVLPAANGRVVGILQNKPDDGESGALIESGISKVWVGATGIEAGDDVTTDADGHIIQATSGDSSVGIALKTNAADELGTVLLRLTTATVAGS